MRLPGFRHPAPPDHMPSREAISLVLICTLAVLSLHAVHVPLWMVLAALCLIVWRYLIDNLGWRSPGSLVRMLLAIAMVVMVYIHHQSLLGRDPGVAMLFGLTGLKALELRRLRDYLLTVFLLYFLTLAAFLYSQSLWVGAYALLVVALTTLCLVQLNQALGTPLTRGMRLAGGLLIKSIPLMCIVYLLFPRIQGSLWGVPVDAYGTTGLNERLQMGSVHQLISNDRVAFRVEFDGEPPANRDLYWRALVLEDTDGRVWTRRNDLDDDPVPEAIRERGREVNYNVTLEPHNQRWLVALELPTVTPAMARRRAGYVVEAKRKIRKRFRYQVRSHLDYRTGALSRDQRFWGLHLAKAPTPRMQQLVDDWRATAQTPAALVQLSLNYFREEPFFYTLSPGDIGNNPVDEFLFETRRGYCEYFATSFVTLMRMADVPSRLVVGYQGGEWNSAGNYMVVRGYDAHAWAEVWLPGRGWQRADPTAAVAPERVELGFSVLNRMAQNGQAFGVLDVDDALAAAQLSWWQRGFRETGFYLDFLNNTWNQLVLDYDVDQQREWLRAFGIKAPAWIVLTGTLVLVVALLLLIMAAVMLQPRRHRDPVVAWYRRFCAKLARLGLERAGYEGPWDFAQRVSRQRPDLDSEVRRITSTYVDVRYRNRLAALPALRRQIRQFRPARSADA